MSPPAGPSGERMRRILDAFDQVLDIEEGARDAWLIRCFPEDADAVRAVKALVAADAVAAEVMPTEISGHVGQAVLTAPDRIGPFRLDSIIGVGGMGEVWHGVRDDGLFDQQVAIKLMRPSRYAIEALSFFDTERRALARLNHPNIARLLDGGITDAGLPWFIMELIDGAPLHVHAAGRSLTKRESLALMVQIAGATQYAHQQLVVHADLKPSNILIRNDGTPCLVDFGIASLAANAAEQDDKITFPSTPAYASPERLAGKVPTPSDDIFALGLLLHGLLTGSWHETALREPLPSTGDADCDAVIARATALQADQRYPTAQGFGDDLLAMLDHRPTSLQAGQWRPQARLMVKRHPRAVAAGMAAILGTVAALALITGLYIQAAHERSLAEKRFNDVRSLANYMLGDFHDELVKLPGSTALRERNATVGWQYIAHLSQDATVPVDVQRDIAVGYGRLGNAQATTSSNGNGKVRDGDWALAQSESQLRALVKAYPGRDDFRRELAWTLTLRSGLILTAHKDPKGARAAIDESFALYDGVIQRNPNDLEAAYGRWNATQALADMYYGQNALPKLKALMEETLARFRSLPVPEAYRSRHALLEATSENSLGDASYYVVGKQAGVDHYLRARDIMVQASQAGLMDMRIPQREGYYDYQLSSSYQDMGQPQQALLWAERGETLIADLTRYDDSAPTLHILDILSMQRSMALADMGRVGEAADEAELAVSRRRRMMAIHPADQDNRVNLAVTLQRLGDRYMAAKRPGQACGAAREAVALFSELDAHGGLADRYKQGEMPAAQALVAKCPT